MSPKPHASYRLICFPYAGGNASVFKGWPESLPDRVEVYGVQLPGRANRLNDLPMTDMAKLADTLVTALADLFERPFAFYGHSLGAIVSFELARRLQLTGGPTPCHLFVSGRRAPHLPDTDPWHHTDSDVRFVAHLKSLNGTPRELLDNSALLDLVLPAIRADFAMVETYVYRDAPPLSCPITVIGGAADEESAADRLDEWRRQTRGAFSRRVVPGDHFFIHSHTTDLLRVLASEIARWPASGAVGETGSGSHEETDGYA